MLSWLTGGYLWTIIACLCDTHNVCAYVSICSVCMSVCVCVVFITSGGGGSGVGLLNIIYVL